jgi:hypothetical protein
MTKHLDYLQSVVDAKFPNNKELYHKEGYIQVSPFLGDNWYTLEKWGVRDTPLCTKVLKQAEVDELVEYIGNMSAE